MPNVTRLIRATLALVVIGSGSACSTVEPGNEFAIAAVTYDENYFYCVVEPKVLMAKSCGTGDQSQGDATGGCHSSVTSFRLNPTATAVMCNGLTPTEAVPLASQANYQAAQGEMTLDYVNAPLIAWPTQKFSGHPRQIFKPDSDEYNIIKDWATKYASH
jgi:hypothetical protein